MSSNQQDQRESVTASEADAPELFDFGPDVERPPSGPQAVLPPWMTGPAREPAEPAELEDEVTPEPVVVPEFARIVPAPRRRRKPATADDVVIAAPAVLDGSGHAAVSPLPTDRNADVDTRSGTGAPVAPLVPAQRTEVAAEAPVGAEEPEPVAVRPRRRWVGRAQAAAIVAIGASVGIYAAGGLGFLENRTKANPPTAEAGAWVLNNLAGAGTVLVPSSMTDALLQHGQDADALTTYPDDSTAPVELGKNCCSYLVVIGAPGEAVGAGLPESVHTLFERSRPAAVFTTDGGWTQVRQVLPGAPDKVAADLAAEHKALVATGKSLIASGRVEFTDVAKQQLRSGEVDARVLLGIVALVREHKITVAGFPAQPGEAAAGILRRSAAITKIDGKPVKDGSDRVKSVKNALASQSGVFRPAGAKVHAVEGVNAFEFRFDAPSPFGLLSLTESGGKR